jgi:hypothetical protein
MRRRGETAATSALWTLCCGAREWRCWPCGAACAPRRECCLGSAAKRVPEPWPAYGYLAWLVPLWRAARSVGALHGAAARRLAERTVVQSHWRGSTPVDISAQVARSRVRRKRLIEPRSRFAALTKHTAVASASTPRHCYIPDHGSCRGAVHRSSAASQRWLGRPALPGLHSAPNRCWAAERLPARSAVPYQTRHGVCRSDNGTGWPRDRQRGRRIDS